MCSDCCADSPQFYLTVVAKRARKLLVPWGGECDQALAALIEIVTSPQILDMMNWGAPFQLHTDASELGAGAALTQGSQGD